MVRQFAGLILAVGALANSGCGGPPPLIEVTGKVAVDGKPADHVIMAFWPGDGSNHRLESRYAVAVSEKDGTFSLVCSRGVGLEAGTYKVTFSRIVSRGKAIGDLTHKAEDAGSVETIPALYRDPKQTPIEVVIGSQQRELAFDVPTR